jgi:aspartyl-tRNA(Asn)/glutamyl-tRNA(Gln) amidotransferase subunit A
MYELGGLAGFGASLRSGNTTAAAVTKAYLARITALEPQLQCFEVVLAKEAEAAASAIDTLLAAGTDLGRLMGVPVAIKDIYAVTGTTATNGSNYPSNDVTGVEGAFVASLRQAGCVIIGKTKTAEFAFSANGSNEARGTPLNPWDVAVPRWPGGSSSGSGVAMGAGLCAFAMGSDTGGSVRIPAAFNGVVGHKTTIGVFPRDGIFPLSPALDTVGPLCRTAADAALIHAALDPTSESPKPPELAGLVFGRPTVNGLRWFEENLEKAVAAAFEAAMAVLAEAGATVVDTELADFGIDLNERETLFPHTVGPELVSALGLPRFAEWRKVADPKTEARASAALEVTAVQHAVALRRLRELPGQAAAAFAASGVCCWISPTVTMTAGTVAELGTPAGAARGGLCSRNTQPLNLIAGCGVTLPLATNAGLPAGLQLMFEGGSDAAALALARAVEAALPTPPRPALG